MGFAKCLWHTAKPLFPVVVPILVWDKLTEPDKGQNPVSVLDVRMG